MADFDPQDVISVVPANSGGSDFDEKDIIRTLPAGQDFLPEDIITPVAAESEVDKEIRDRSFFNRPALGAEYTKKEEIAGIAKKHGVDPEELEKLAPYFGARIEGSSFFSPEEFKRVAGGLGQAVGLNIPQKLYKKAQSDQMEAALDDIQNLASGRQSYTQLIGEVVVPAVGVGGRAVTAAGKAAAGAATGAAAGYAGSSREQEVAGTLFGAGLGGAASALAARYAGKAAPKAEKEVVEKVIQREGPELDAGMEAILKQRAASEDDIQKIVSGTGELDASSASRIVKEQLPEELVQEVMDPSTVSGKLLKEKVERELPEVVSRDGIEKAIELQLAKEKVDNRLVNFAQDLTGKKPKGAEEAREMISEYSSRQGKEAVASQYKTFVDEQATLDYVNKAAIRAGRGDNFGDRTLNTLSDAQFVFRDIDDKLGTSTEAVHRDLNSAANRMSFARNDARKDLGEIFNRNREVDDTIVNTDKLYNALDTGDVAGLSPQELRAANDFKQFFQKQLNYVNNLVKSKDPNISPLSIPKRENYVPHSLKDSEEILSGITKRVNELKELSGRKLGDISELTKQEFRELQDTQPMKELMEALNVFDGKPIKDSSDLSARLKDTFYTRAGQSRMETVARAALERQEGIPEWMREKNLYKLADRWTSNTLKHLYLRKDMNTLRSIANRIEAAGGDLEARYIRNLLADINGIRKGTAAEWTRGGNLKYMQALDKLGEKYPGKAAQGAIAVAKAFPTILSDINRQVYPNLLGLSPRALIMNATQTIAKTAPELGTKYGYTTLFRGAINAVLNWKQMQERLAQQGFVPAEFISKYNRAVADGIRRSSLYAIPSETLKGMGDAAMYFYTKMDAFNRAVALGTADMMANDLAKGSKLARQSLNKFPATVRKQVARAGSPQEVASIIGSHLNAATQYNYNRMSMSEYGRTMGPLFSTFSKWPTATLGEIIQEYREKGLIKGTLRNAEKFIAPLLLFQAADYMLYGNDPEQMSDRQKKLLGMGGLSQSSPIGSVEGILKGDFFTPPAVDAITQAFIVPALEGDANKLQRGLSSAINNFTPGAVYVRFLTDDLPTLIKGERPEGSTFIERSISGAKEITK